MERATPQVRRSYARGTAGRRAPGQHCSLCVSVQIRDGRGTLALAPSGKFGVLLSESVVSGAEREDISLVRGDFAGARRDLAGVHGDLADAQGDLAGVCGDLARVRGDLAGVRGDLAVYAAILRVYAAILRVYAAILRVYAAILRVYAAILRVHVAIVRAHTEVRVPRVVGSSSGEGRPDPGPAFLELLVRSRS
jgi:hypothetical protein